jgi:hypothetical protein
MRKILKYRFFIILLLFCSQSFGINSIPNLDKQIREYGAIFINDTTQIPSKYILTLDEFKTIGRPKMDSIELQKNYINYTSKVKRLYQNTKTNSQFVKSIISYDTITKVEKGKMMISVCIVYENGKNAPEKTQRILTIFVIIDNQLKLSPSIKPVTLEDYLEFEFKSISEIRRKEFDNTFLKIAYFDTLSHFIPYKKTNLWGLQNYEDKVIISAQYDSISPFENDFAIVVKNKKYNLIDDKGDILFKPWKDDIYYKQTARTPKQSGIFFIKTTDGNYLEMSDDTSEVKVKEQLSQPEDPPNTVYVEDNTKPMDSYNIKKVADNYYSHKNFKMYNYTDPYTFELYDERIGQKIATFKGYSKMDRFGDFFTCVRNDTTFVIDTLGKIIFNTTYLNKTENPGYMLLLNRNTRLFGVYCPYTHVYIAPEYVFINPINRDLYFVVVTKDKKLGYINKKGKKLFE